MAEQLALDLAQRCGRCPAPATTVAPNLIYVDTAVCQPCADAWARILRRCEARGQ